MKYGKRTGLIKFDMAWVDSKGPCYPASRYLVPGKRYDAVKILKDERIPFEDRLWVVLRSDLMSERLLRLFAVWCARQVQHLMEDASLNALDAAELFVDGIIDNAAGDAARRTQCDKLIEMFLVEGQERLVRHRRPFKTLASDLKKARKQ